MLAVGRNLMHTLAMLPASPLCAIAARLRPRGIVCITTSSSGVHRVAAAHTHAGQSEPPPNTFDWLRHKCKASDYEGYAAVMLMPKQSRASALAMASYVPCAIVAVAMKCCAAIYLPIAALVQRGAGVRS